MTIIEDRLIDDEDLLDVEEEGEGDIDLPKWLKDTLNIVKRICQRKEEFTSDDIWAIASHLKNHPDDRRVIGSVLRTAAHKGYCAPTERYIPSKRRACHGRRVLVWQSLLIEED